MKKRLFSILYMFVLTLFFTSIVSGVKIYNEAKIETNQRVKLQRIILQVLRMPVGESRSDRKVEETFEQRVKEIEAKDRTLYVGYAQDGRTITGYAFPVSGPGFWGPVYGMVAVDPSATKIMGVAFYKHSETPGLGARITEEWFTKQFSGLPLHPIEGKNKIFSLKPAGAAKARNELDAVTGATGTSRAVEAFLNKELDHFLKDVRPELKKQG